MNDQPDTITPMDDAGIGQAASLLKAGDVVAFPTETVYGLGADATNDKAVAKIFDVKGRPQFNPLIVHFGGSNQAWTEAEPSETALKLAETFWPGPLTMVLRRKSDCRLSRLVSAGLDSVAVRVPSHTGAQALLDKVNSPVAAPSANRSGGISPTSAQHVRASLGNRVSLILDGGTCDVGLESTIVDATQVAPVILRPGGITKEMLQDASGQFVDRYIGKYETDGSSLTAPGQLLSHYAPKAHVRLNANSPRLEEVLLGFGPVKGATLNLSPAGNIVEAAANLFDMLHRLDAMKPSTIAVSPIPHHGLGEAINDRLQRASAPRS